MKAVLEEKGKGRGEEVLRIRYLYKVCLNLKWEAYG